MKKITLYAVATCLSLAFLHPQVRATTSTTPTTLSVSKPVTPVAVQLLVLRLKEIEKMDKSNLTAADKKELRKEVRSIKQQLQSTGGGVYLSAGAIIIILLILIILF